ncbi:MAG: DUF4340 domain-containing protein [Phycisphaeraceae bacterium]|nr:DUF4340 domain-containing protein [Phycisphaeraceae bacterium]
MITRGTAILLALALALAAGATVLARRGGDSGAASIRRPLFGEPGVSVTGRIVPDQPRRIRLERTGQPALVFERDGAHWNQVEPFAFPLDPGSVDLLLRAMRQVRVLARMPAGAAPDTVGLAPPRAVLEVTPAEGDPLRVVLGRRGLAGRAFLRCADPTDGPEDQAGILVTDPVLHERILAGDPREWRERRLFQSAGQDVTAIDIRATGLALRIVRQGRAWRLAEPVSARAETTTVDVLLDELARVSATGFLADAPPDLSPYGLREPAGTIEITGARADGEERRERLLVGARVGATTADRYGMLEGRPVVVRLPEAVLRLLFRAAEEFIAGNGADVLAPDVRSITIRTAAGTLDLERDLDRWTMHARAADRAGADAAGAAPSQAWPDLPAGTPVDRARVEALFRALTEVRAARLEIGAWPQDREIATVTFYAFSGAPIDTVRLGRPESGPGLVLENGDRVLRTIPPSVEVPLHPDAYRGR